MFHRLLKVSPLLRMLCILATVVYPMPSSASDGTWGIHDENLTHASYLSLYNQGGHTVAEIDIGAPDAWCDARQLVEDSVSQRWERVGIPVERNEAEDRYEWIANMTNDSSQAEVCWLSTKIEDEKLRATIHCPSICPRAKPIVLDHIANTHLVPPRGFSERICVSHDLLQQQLCQPGLRSTIERAKTASEKWHGLVDSKAEEAKIDKRDLDWNHETTLLNFIAGCRTKADPIACLSREIGAAADALQTEVDRQEQLLAGERAASEGRQVVLESVSKEWEGRWFLSNPTFSSALTIDECRDSGCMASLDASTNYTFGEAHRHGYCEIDDVSIAFTSASDAFGYESEDHLHEHGFFRDPFVNYCRMDLHRTTRGVDVSLRGVGCGWNCRDAAQQYELMEGGYRQVLQPSFECKRSDFEELGWDEQMICLDDELAGLDKKLAAAYRQALSRTSPAMRSAMIKEQQVWIKQRSEHCEREADAKACLRSAYESRLQQLAK